MISRRQIIESQAAVVGPLFGDGNNGEQQSKQPTAQHHQPEGDNMRMLMAMAARKANSSQNGKSNNEELGKKTTTGGQATKKAASANNKSNSMLMLQQQSRVNRMPAPERDYDLDLEQELSFFEDNQRYLQDIDQEELEEVDEIGEEDEEEFGEEARDDQDLREDEQENSEPIEIRGQHNRQALAASKTANYNEPRKAARNMSREQELLLQQQQQQQMNKNSHDDYRHFDPYSVYGEEDEEEDVWYSEERLFEDHMQEIIDKWLAIDDEIWAKIICMERNRRIAKAYARKHALTVNGSEDEYLDGTTLGLNSFENPDRDTKTRQIKQYIGQGLRIKITQSGDIVVKRLSKANVFVHHHQQQQQQRQQQRQQKAREHRQAYPATSRLRAAISNSDLYEFNSETSDLYGVVGPRLDGAFSSAAFRSQVSRVAAKRLGHNNNNAPFSALSTSDASTSSSSGACSGSGSGIGSGHSNGRHDEHDSKLGVGLVDSKAKQLDSNGRGRLLLGAGRHSVALDYHRAVKIFDMNKFKGLLERESRKAHPNRRRLQNKCISIISFVADDQKMLNLPSWIMVINIVAIDLLRSELGLLGVHDYLGPPGTTTAAVPPLDPLNDACRFGQLARAAVQHKQALRSQQQRPPLVGANDNNNSKLAAYSLSSSSYELNQHLQNNNPLSASKKAFANAAALGAYNGELHCSAKAGVPRHQQQQSRLTSAEICKLNGHHSELAASISDNEHQQEQFGSSCNCSCDSALKPTKGGQQLAASDCIESCAKQVNSTSVIEPMLTTHQQSSSSSGFNSHCSSQNDSSAASSSSNIAATGACSSSSVANMASVCDEPTSIVLSEGNIAHDCLPPPPPPKDCKSPSKKKVPFYKHLTSSKQHEKHEKQASAASKSFTDLPSSTLSPSQPQQSRGKRPPKLPHRLFGTPKSAAGSKPMMSESIPIPAPPTSAGDCPSGNANLILVSPTGLSPPLPKRKLGLGKLAGRVSSSQVDLSQAVPEIFSTIKHIDETGQCTSVLMRENIRPSTAAAANESDGRQPTTKGSGNSNKLPPGIPAHAQLAPPATQRHILRYLMMATQGGKLCNSDAASKVPPVPPVRYQRPLPILPGQQQPADARLAASSARCAGSVNELCQLQQQQHDESLYYCGLQARVPLRRVPVSVPTASKHAINSLLEDLKLRNSASHRPHNQHQQQHYPQQPKQYQCDQQCSTPSSQATRGANVFFSRRA